MVTNVTQSKKPKSNPSSLAHVWTTSQTWTKREPWITQSQRSQALQVMFEPHFQRGPNVTYTISPKHKHEQEKLPKATFEPRSQRGTWPKRGSSNLKNVTLFQAQAQVFIECYCKCCVT
ncbi:hypothetical protein PIB30_083392 [Stylosanthes scabra]|uniref:Uncharacterized protein n=1 Tax=Stylosanthes scabra TaxID=79078 RepID=A0ABU6RT47_9FABA|nr:hypothetical protein [Stylosanthes scabra]